MIDRRTDMEKELRDMFSRREHDVVASAMPSHVSRRITMHKITYISVAAAFVLSVAVGGTVWLNDSGASTDLKPIRPAPTTEDVQEPEVKGAVPTEADLVGIWRSLGGLEYQFQPGGFFSIGGTPPWSTGSYVVNGRTITMTISGNACKGVTRQWMVGITKRKAGDVLHVVTLGDNVCGGKVPDGSPFTFEKVS